MVVRRLVAFLVTAVASDSSTDRPQSGRDRSSRQSGRGLSARCRGQPLAAGGSDRGQSELVGTVLILGLSMAVIGTSVALGGVALADLITSAEADNVENGMSHLSSKANLVALGDADSQRFTLGLMREGTVSVQPDAGSITITHVTNDSRDEAFNGSLGALVYESDDRKVAYQGGGIWTKRNGNGSLTSPPEYYYRGTTLTFPIIQITGSGSVGGQPSGQITPVGVATNAVPNVSSPLENGTIEVKVQSEFYEGWYQYFTQRADGVTTIYHSNQTVISTLTVPDEITFNTAVSLEAGNNPGIDPNGNSKKKVINPENSYRVNAAHRSAQPLIERRVREENESGSGCLSTAGCTLTSGTYFYDGDLVLDNNTEIDTSDGNVTIVVDGDLDIQNNEITSTDTEWNDEVMNGTRYYINGSFDAQGNGYIGTDNSSAEASRNILYIRDGFLDDATGSGNINLDAVIYAPDAVVNTKGNANITGALVAKKIKKLGGSAQIYYDSTLSDTTIELTGAGSLLTYLHVSHNEIEIELD